MLLALTPFTCHSSNVPALGVLVVITEQCTYMLAGHIFAMLIHACLTAAILDCIFAGSHQAEGSHEPMPEVAEGVVAIEEDDDADEDDGTALYLQRYENAWHVFQ